MVDVDALDVFQVLDILKQEEKLANGFFRMGIKNEYLSMLMDLESSNERVSYAVDFRPASPEYLNNLDTDKQYRQWANSVGLLLQPYFPGMLRPIARNLFTLDLMHFMDNEDLFVSMASLVPLGVVYVTNDENEITGFDDASVAMLNLYNFVKINSGIRKAVDVLIEVLNVEQQSVSPKDVLSYFQVKYPDHDPNDVFGSNSNYDNGRAIGHKFLRDSGLGLTPKVLLNGIVLDDSDITSDHFEETIMMEIMRVTSRLQKAVMEKRLKDQDNVMNWILSQPEVMPRINKLILDSPLSPDALYLDLTSIQKCTNTSPAHYYKLPPKEQNQCMLKRMRYITRTEEMRTHFSTVWVVSDLETAEGRLLAYNAIKHLKHSYTMRVAIINNPKDIEAATTSGSVTMLVNLASRLLIPRQMKSFITKLVKEEIVSKLLNKQITLDDLAVNDMNMTVFYKESRQINSEEIIADAKYSRRILDLRPGQLALVVNGLLIGPLGNGQVLDVEDMELIDKLILLRGGKIIGDYMEKWKIRTRHGESSDMVMRSMALIGSIGVTKNDDSFHFQDILTINGTDEEGLISVLCIVDPLSVQAQRLSHLLTVIQKVVNLEVKLVMNPKAKLSELPLKRFYRLVLQPTIMFDDSGRINSAAYEARFTALPNKQLLTLAVVPPDAWMVQPVYAIYDLDNIKLENVTGNVVAKFELEHILLEGHCFDDMTGSPPRGLQFTLGTLTNPNRYDTIVMANLGYFQLKADPGAWILNLRDGKSKDIYNIVSHVHTESVDETGVNVLIDSFSGRTIRIRETLPEMAKHYGFQYEFVEYRWPRWLHQQTEKQRVMWGYKILFLDVLFLLNIRKIIFVDADQIVRTDLMELMELDLGGAPYGFTPFCDSRTSMDGFRFWKRGYWANHLAGRKYHISALYVIDLVKFRQVAAGDRLRGQYQGLSADPNSLSNLDQDLPNNMIHQVRIKSLPQEWLWCETWCDDASKNKAKTIDLCNNPQTKEPKLESAMRIIPEWKDYDTEIKTLFDERSKSMWENQGNLSIRQLMNTLNYNFFVHSIIIVVKLRLSYLMSSRIYRLWQPGNPKTRVFLPNFWMKVVDPFPTRLPKHVVKFEVDKRMTRYDVREYLEKIYNLPVREVRTLVKAGYITYDFPLDKEKRRALWKENDKKYAYVFMKKGFEFHVPNLFEKCEEQEMWDKMKQKLPDITNAEYINRDRHGIGEFLS
ncbi:UDP-glucose:glycoprotein glucosyltransferase [Dirofilaria immitis]|nr:UDP-glucose:glycoprotein glucosyltransferase [Dirofilaria immitis]